jgi:hypothetical protein
MLIFLDSFLCVFLDEHHGRFEELRHLLHDSWWFLGQKKQRVEAQYDSCSFMLQLILVLVGHQLLQHISKIVVIVSQSQHPSGSQPQQHPHQLRGQRLHHFALELVEVYLSELVYMVVDVLRQSLLVIFQEIDQESRAAGDIELATELIRWFFVHLAN